MEQRNSDQLIIKQLGIKPKHVEYDEQGYVIELDLSQLALAQLPEQVKDLVHLQRLNLSGNQLTEIPPELGQLAALQDLDLYENQLTEIPPELGQLSNLQNLDLSSNRLTEIPAELAQLSSLQYLQLHNNQLKQIPPEINQLPNLQYMSLSKNPDLVPPAPEIITSQRTINTRESNSARQVIDEASISGENRYLLPMELNPYESLNQRSSTGYSPTIAQEYNPYDSINQRPNAKYSLTDRMELSPRLTMNQRSSAGSLMESLYTQQLDTLFEQQNAFQANVLNQLKKILQRLDDLADQQNKLTVQSKARSYDEEAPSKRTNQPQSLLGKAWKWYRKQQPAKPRRTIVDKFKLGCIIIFALFIGYILIASMLVGK